MAKKEKTAEEVAAEIAEGRKKQCYLDHLAKLEKAKGKDASDAEKVKLEKALEHHQALGGKNLTSESIALIVALG